MSSREVYQPRYLIRRPLLQALQAPAPGAVLLIDEVDRADEPFEAFLLEYLGEYQVSIPELGTVAALVPPVTILTSNRTRELNDAVKRRCLYHWLDYPERERELAIVRAQVPKAGEVLSGQVAAFVERLRSAPFAGAFQRAPGIAESVEWARALIALDTRRARPRDRGRHRRHPLQAARRRGSAHARAGLRAAEAAKSAGMNMPVGSRNAAEPASPGRWCAPCKGVGVATRSARSLGVG